MDLYPLQPVAKATFSFLLLGSNPVLFRQANSFALLKDDVIFVAEVFLMDLKELVFFFKNPVFIFEEPVDLLPRQ